MKISQDNKQALRNPWVLGWLLLLVLVLTVNVIFIVTAFYTSPGLVERDYYEKGRDHEENVRKKLAARSALGWEMHLDVPEKAQLGVVAPYRLTVVDRVGQPLKGAVVTLQAYRPADAAADFDLSMSETMAGQYQAEIRFPLKGIWDLKVRIAHKEDSYDIEQRIIVHE